MEKVLGWTQELYTPNGNTKKGFGTKYATLLLFNTKDAQITKPMHDVIKKLEDLKQNIDHYLGAEAVVFVMEKCLEMFVRGLKIHIPSDFDDENASLTNNIAPSSDIPSKPSQKTSKSVILGVGGLQLIFVEVEFILECMESYVTMQCRKFFDEFLEQAITFVKNTGTSIEIDQRELSKCAKRLGQQKKEVNQHVVG
ncbi:hypothetical protein RFI_07886 [Reticulomyxa filosa]|uniref:Uncharacterized protein n=1 Tax=Reticulomyxa filosa TaxID=46433 RepID=X6NTB4_RETFI|nr:hypothetical protein RFI_07886 [Reticulomyxa filosa]|eukprot:ETO29241.1 hypothetical protein RFI_07886 [Reticulomyxa filosa]